jgi:hypothetical protein
MRVEVTEKKLRDAGYDLVQGDTLTVPEDIGSRWCGFGWAKDTSGRVKTGERIPGARRLDIHNSRHAGRRGGRGV